MPQHFIHYLPRRIVMRTADEANSPWFAGAQTPASGFSRPVFHTSRRKTGPTQSVKPGDTIWILSQVFSPWGILPPALDSRIDVERIEEGDEGVRRFVAAGTSSWFPLSDITALLGTLQSKDAKGNLCKIQSDPHTPVGRCLQSMRLLHNAQPLETWGRKLASEKTHFISYRICDGTPGAFALARKLLIQGEAVFWDRWCLPRRLAERREVVSDSALDEYLMSHLRQSKTVWGIESKKYAIDGSYAAKEQSEATRLGIYTGIKA